MVEETLIYDAGFDESFGRALEEAVTNNSIETLKNFKNVFKKIIHRIEQLENVINENRVNVSIDVDREIEGIVVVGNAKELNKLLNNISISEYCGMCCTTEDLTD